jgi:cysteinyl-tRNA synthetase
MDDDFNTPKAFAVIFDFVNKSNRFLENNTQVNAALCRHSLGLLLKLGSTLTLFQPRKVQQDETVLLEKLQKLILKYDKEIEAKSIEEIIKTLIGIREEARKQKEWKKADKIRNELQNLGFELQDTSKGPVWKKK